jgi:polysaccharide biosynthesis protein PslH
MPRILFVTSRLPYPPTEGHQLRSWHLLRAACAEHQVDLLSLLRPEDPPTPAPLLTEHVHSIHTVPLPALGAPGPALALAGRWLRHRQPLLVARYVSDALRAAFRERVERADLVHLDILPLAGLMSELPDSTPVVLNEHNVEHILLRSRAEIEPVAWRRQLLRRQIGELQRFEASACSAADRVLACSATDAERLLELAPTADVRVVPNGVDLDFFRGPHPAVEDDRTLVFVGQMGWFPNRDGVLDFIAHGLPLLRRRHPQARLRVIGRRDGVQLAAGDDDAVEFTGFIDDLRPAIREAAVYVVPLRAGSGTRLKLLEAMAMGKAIVSTRIGAEGIALRDGREALLADSAEEFAAAISRLFDDRALRLRLGSAARHLVERDYGWEAIGARLRETYGELLSTRSVPRTAIAALPRAVHSSL